MAFSPESESDAQPCRSNFSVGISDLRSAPLFFRRRLSASNKSSITSCQGIRIVATVQTGSEVQLTGNLEK
jgi:hypothetical protein